MLGIVNYFYVLMIIFFLSYRQKKFCDAQLHFGKNVVDVHKAVLSSHSKYFEKIFEFKNTMKYSLRVSKNVDETAMMQLIMFMYSSHLKIDEKNVKVINYFNSLSYVELVIL